MIPIFSEKSKHQNSEITPFTPWLISTWMPAIFVDLQNLILADVNDRQIRLYAKFDEIGLWRFLAANEIIELRRTLC